MAVQLFIFENEADVLSYYVERLTDRGFDEIYAFDNTENLIRDIGQLYVKPSIIVSDYFIDPAPPSRFLPDLKQAGFSLPAVIISGSIKLQQINALSYRYPVLGFFDKGTGPREMINLLAQHLVDITPDAVLAFEKHSLRRLAMAIVDDLNRLEREVALKLLCFEEPKNVIIDPKLHVSDEDREGRVSRDRAYKIQRQIFEFLGRETGPWRYMALHEALSL